MATFEVAEGTDFVGTIEFGTAADRWRLDDWVLTAHLKAPGDPQELIEMTDTNGRLIIRDAVNRRLEINVSWTEISDLTGAAYEFDIVFENRTTGIRRRSEPYTLAITRGITKVEA